MPGPTHAASSITGSLHLEATIPNQDAWQAHRAAPYSLYAVLDGHGPGGQHIASRAADTLLRTATARLHPGDADSADADDEPDADQDARPGADARPPRRRHERALRAAFAAAAEHVDSHPDALESGSTATLLLHDAASATLSLANVGDSTAVAARRGRAPLRLSATHRPGPNDNDAAAGDRAPRRAPGPEELRVLRAGAVVRGGYVCHDDSHKMISVTRALGDLDVRALGVIADPHVAHADARGLDFVIVATDGLWDAHGGLSERRAVDAVYKCLDAGGSPSEAVGDLLALAKGKGTRPIDDTTIVLVCLPGAEHSPQQR